MAKRRYNNNNNSEKTAFGISAERYEAILRVAIALGAIGAWWFSIGFSVDGFNFEIAGYEQLGWLLAVIVTLTQLAYNHEGNKNTTIMIVGIAAYCYGIYTNVLGISLAQGKPGIMWDLSTLFPLFVGIFIEVIPESFLVWALTGDSSLADFFANLNESIFDKRVAKANGPTNNSRNTMPPPPPTSGTNTPTRERRYP